MSLLRKASEVYRREGIRKLGKEAVRYTTERVFPKPAVAEESVPRATWILKHPYDLLFRLRHGRGTAVMEEDWDTLILLDACRYDEFERVNQLPGELDDKISRGVDSYEFIRNNFVGNELSDTVYVTANPHVKLLDNSTFYQINTDPIEAWDDELQCVKPEDVTAAAVASHRAHPHKRIIVHYMQPHDPPLGPTADRIRQRADIGGTGMGNRGGGTRIMELVAQGDIAAETARQAYRETLEIALTEVETLLQEIDGKVVVSSDHGEMFGESPYPFLGRLYEHYQNPKTTQLCKVPWFVADTTTDRRNIADESGSETQTRVDDTAIQEQLEALGYRD